ncbi:hypothetical protein LAZ67_2006280 [Cordylochernes scorpioides]|uniref:Reverse transcriptase zinc-binding domain-containing protein n=1 Tax=Cordylochernes scorpioides TaxID=51811 RepID=A0ABY6K565_9ARAC|nr:hypothetical protein LAZ67_2006280 [Cordylochernes scorpioides]
MNEIFENTNGIFRSFFVFGIPRFFRPNFYNIQFITDHGNFGKFLATIGAVKEPGCFCGGEIQDARHLLLDCPIFRDFRENRFGRIGQLDEFVDKKEKRPLQWTTKRGDLRRNYEESNDRRKKRLEIFKSFLTSQVNVCTTSLTNI